MEDWIVIGTVFRRHGLRGDVKVYPLTDSPQRFLDLDEVLLEDPHGRRHRVRIDNVRFQKDRVILHFEGKDTLEDIEPLMQSQVLVHRSEAVKLPEGRYYYADIIGLSVYTDREKYLGVIEDILETGSNEVYVVREGSKEVLIPATEQVIQKVDLKNQRLIVHGVEGLLE
jgi:16S rRNA processing protein RimM